MLDHVTYQRRFKLELNTYLSEAIQITLKAHTSMQISKKALWEKFCAFATVAIQAH